MSAAGTIRFCVCVAFAVIWWVFLTPLIDTLNAMEPFGAIVTQQRLDTQQALVLGFKISPVLLLLAIGIQLWATSLRRTSGASGGVRLGTIIKVYVSQIGLLVTCIVGGALIDELTYQMMGLPAITTNMPLDSLYLGLSWLYPLLTIAMIAIYVGLFFTIGRDVYYQYSGSKGKAASSKFW